MARTIVLIAALPIIMAAGCSKSWLPTFYRIDIQQGNLIEQEQVDQLRIGMTKAQVQFLMGTPLIGDPFHQQRWDYFYSFRRDGKLQEKSRITLFFEGDLLNRIDTSAFDEPIVE